MTLKMLSASLSEQSAEILIGLGTKFSEGLYFKFYLQNSANPFFFPEKCQFSRGFRQKLAQIIDNCSQVLKHTSHWGHFLVLYVSITGKFALSSPCDFNMMTSEAEANPLMPEGQFSPSESRSGTYYCMSKFH